MDENFFNTLDELFLGETVDLPIKETIEEQNYCNLLNNKLGTYIDKETGKEMVMVLGGIPYPAWINTKKFS